MINSMTGFGAKECKVASFGKVCVELRTSNHKFLEVVLHLPEGFLALEEKVKKEIEAKIKRGRVVCAINISGGEAAAVSVNEKLLKNYVEATKKIQRQFAIKDSIKLDTLLSLPGVLSLSESTLPKEKIWPVLKTVLADSLVMLSAARRKEGGALAVHLKKEAQALKATLEGVRQRFKKVIREKAQKIALDEERAAFLKNSDITEEMERLSYHIANFMARLSKGGSVGKELDFIAQEMQRETNTMGAKSCDTVISGEAVELKSRIEKIREQVQNVE
ncbi:MAG: YicC family protein [Candidatus Omnitrophica bacterium]|nr:YicC family protein [Candidatus Omnitrophota bacterium]MDD5653400.1 YicC family protein [Candidatus Omnitrophota bacterium]